jgi:tricarballylate dehydrogenase
MTPSDSAYAVTGGITFGFGGGEIIEEAEVRDGRGHMVVMLYAEGNCTVCSSSATTPSGSG